jgi:hypothetical protein
MTENVVALDALSQEVREATTQESIGGAITLSLKSLPSGLYFARVQTSKSVSMLKIVKV